MITRLLLRRGLFITTENTPNPNSLKFMPGRDVLGAGQTYDFPHITDSTCSPLAKRIFSVQGVQACMFGPDYMLVSIFVKYFLKVILTARLHALTRTSSGVC